MRVGRQDLAENFVVACQSEAGWYLKLWVVLALLFLFLGLLLQLVIIPYGFPRLDAGHGLIIGGDWVGFQRLAAKMAAAIHTEGWSAWRLRPEGQAPAGITAAIYAVFLPRPYVVVPFYAAMYAVDVVATAAVYRRIGFGRFESVAGILPAVAFPSTMMMYATFNKDAIAGAGYMLVLLGWVRFLGVFRASQVRWRSLLQVCALVATGIGFVWIVRPYGVRLLEAGSVIVASMLVAVIAWVNRSIGHRDYFWRIGVSCIVDVALLTGMHYAADVQTSGVTAATVGVEAEATVGAEVSKASNIFEAISHVREQFVEGYPKAESMIDVHVHFHNAWDVVRYVPRAIQIAFLAPFPDMWFGKGSAASSRLMRRDAAFEMVLAYFALFFGVFAVVKHGFAGRPDFWIVIIYCTVIIGVYVLAVPNVGSLFRFRQPLYVCILGVGVAGLVRELKSRGGRGGFLRCGKGLFRGNERKCAFLSRFKSFRR